jgi:hypothetical protein
MNRARPAPAAWPPPPSPPGWRCGVSAARTVPTRPPLARPRLEGKLVHLRSSVNVLPFHADASRRLVTPLHLDSISPGPGRPGAPVAGGPGGGGGAAGTAARVEKLEFRRAWGSPAGRQALRATAPGCT